MSTCTSTLGLQADSEDELAELKARAQAADMALLDEGETTCCYARSDKYWLTDPDGVAWEQFHTLATIPTFSEAHKADEPPQAACCATAAPRGKPVGIPVAAAKPSCC
jgi:lactoylglutathione lyase